MAGFSKTGSAADAVVAWTRGCRAGSRVLTIAHSRVVGALMSFVDCECADMLGKVYLEIILNCGIDNSVILFGMLRFN